MTFFRDNIDAMAAYVPGEQPAAGQRVIKLNTNENPYPPSPRAMAALATLDPEALRLYPDAMAGAFRQAVADVLDTPAEWVLPGDGSDDVIMMIARSALGPGRRVAYPTPTFTFYRTQALIEGAEIREVPFAPDFRLPIDDLAAADAHVTFIANPNSPSGTAAGNEELAALAARLSGLLVIDEAYVDFAESSALPLVAEFPNVMLLRTLSKGYSLAGLRLGYGVAQPPLIQGLLKTKGIYNVGAAPAAAGAAAMADQACKNANAEKVKASRARLAAALAELGCPSLRSEANFLLTTLPGGRAERAQQALKNRGILVRYYPMPPLRDCLRITVGTDEQNDAVIAALKDWL